MTDPPGDRQEADSQVSDTGRHETDQERYDRNWSELLQEIRVTQMGTQIMTGFLLAAAFQTRMADLTTFQRSVYLTLVVLGVTTTALGLAPVSLHRSLFRRRMKREIVELGHRILRVVIAGVVLMLAGTAVLIFDMVLGTPQALTVGVAVVLGAAMFVVLTRRLARSR